MLYNKNKKALVDCNSFYVSCERLFNPSIIKKPVVVLSSNDGCVISRSTEAKNLDIVKDGILNTHLLSLYGANKIGAKRSINQGGAHVVTPGSKSLDESIPVSL